MSKTIKAFFIDLDGTLLDIYKNGKQSISYENIEAIKNIKKQGVEVIISTGRTLNQFQEFINMTNSKYAIGTNGAQIVDKYGNFLVQHEINPIFINDILDIAIKNKFALEINGDNLAYGPDSKLKQEIVEQLSYKSINNYSFEIPKKAIKILLWGKTIEKTMEFKKKMIIKFPTLEIVTSMGGYTIEFISKKANKGIAAEYIYKNYLNLTKDEVAHIGDSGNDVSTKDYVKHLIIMENATDEVKSHATHLGPNNKNGGVAKVLALEYENH